VLKILPLLLLLPFSSYSLADIEKINNSSFFGLKLLDSDINKVRQQLWAIGGFKQANSTKQKRAIDKFFISYQVKDSYYLEFRYTNSGKVLSAKRLYKMQSIHLNNSMKDITTKELASNLINTLGQPTKIKHIHGSRPYPTYEWETDKIKIIIDREGSDFLGKAFVSYVIKTDPYFVAPI